MKSRLINWLVFGAFFALLPTIMTSSIFGLAGKMSLQTLAESPDVLLFTVFSTASALGDLNTVNPLPAYEEKFKGFKSGLWVGTIFSSAIYGTIVFSNVFKDELGSKAQIYQHNVLILSLVLSLIFGVLSAYVESMIDTMERLRQSGAPGQGGTP